jgi:predicted RNA binding protein YcfA (HicA-like mRNA interferase family)
VVPLKVLEVMSLLERHGWSHVRTTGDHRIYKNAEGRVTVVSGKLGDDVRQGTWRALLRQTGIEEQEK